MSPAFFESCGVPPTLRQAVDVVLHANAKRVQLSHYGVTAPELRYVAYTADFRLRRSMPCTIAFRCSVRRVRAS